MNAIRRSLLGAGKGLGRVVIVVGALTLLLPVLRGLAADGDNPQSQPAPAGGPRAAAGAPTQADIAELVKKLGDSSWRAREDAQNGLTAAGAPAVEELEKALKNDDAEVRQRAQSILQVIRKNMAEGASAAAAKGRIWKSPVKEGVASSAVAGGGVVCFLAFDGTLRAVDANTGKPRWTFEDLVKEAEAKNVNRIVTGVPTLPAPIISGGLVYVSAQFGRLYAVDLKSGEVKWKSASPDGFAPPAVAGGKVFAAGTEKDVHAFDAVTGKEVWTCELEAGSTARPAVSGGTVFVAARDGVLYALDANSGQKKKLAEELADAADVLVAKGGDVVVRTSAAVVCLDPEGGKQKWTYPLQAGGMVMMGNAMIQMQVNNGLQVNNAGNAANNRGPVRQQGDETMLIDGGVVYAAGGGMLHAIDAADGKALWTYKPQNKEDDPAGGAGPNAMVNVQVGGAIVIGGQGRVFMKGLGSPNLSLPAIVGGTMYVASPMGLHAVDVKTRQELWRLESKETVAARPVVVDGVLYYGTADLAGGLGMGGGIMINAANGPGFGQQKVAVVAPAPVAPAPAGQAAGGAAAGQAAQAQPDESGPAFSAIRLKTPVAK